MFHFLLIIMLFLLLTLIRNKVLNFIFLILGSLFVLSEFIAHHILRTPLGTFSWYYFNLESFKMAIVNFKKEFFVFTISTIVAIILMYFLVKYYFVLIEYLSNKYNKKINLISKIISFILLCLTIFLLEKDHNVITSLYDIYKHKKVSDNIKVQDILKKYNITSDIIKDRDNVEATPGKNIVIMILESTENGFFNEDIYPGIMPYLTSLKNNDNWTFSDKLREPGFRSFGSYYTMMTGLPLSPVFEYNNMMPYISKKDALGIGDVLKAAGYNLEVVLSSPFAGADKLFEVYNFKTFYKKDDFYKNGVIDIADNGWGGYKDKDLFELAKIRYDQLSKDKKPFLQMIITINVHYPNGICEDRIPMVDDTCIESAVRNQDAFIKDYMDHISKNPAYKDTIVLIVPDHISMSQMQAKDLKDTDRRLYYLINRKKEDIDMNTDKYFHYMYFPQKLLDIAGVKSNTRLWAELYKDNNSITQEELNIITRELWGSKK